MQKEYKYLKIKDILVDETGKFEGYASVFGNVDSYGDVVQRGAFKRTLKSAKGKFPILDQHWSSDEIGLTTDMEEDERGLKFTGVLHISDNPKMDMTKARDVYIKMQNRAKLGMPLGVSIGYQTIQSEKDTTNNTRVLKEIKLWEISLVTFPANTEATVTGVKSAEMFRSLRKNIDFLGAMKYNDLSEEQKNVLGTIQNTIDSLLVPDSQKHSAPTPEKVNVNVLLDVFKRE